MKMKFELILLKMFGLISTFFLMKSLWIFFSKAEQEYCNAQSSPGEHYAARFAAKEAVLKAFSGFGIRIRLWDVEVVLDQLGVPRARVCDVLDDVDCEIKISISHSERGSVGFAVVYIKESIF